MAYVDVVRGVAVISMVFFQSLGMLTSYDLYGQWWLPFFNWVTLFMVMCGFSLQLAYEKYGLKKLFLKTVKRAVWFGLIGLVLTLYCGFPKEPFAEIVSTIGVCSLITTPLFIYPKKTLFIIFAVCTIVLRFLAPLPFMFQLHEILFYFTIGILLACYRKPQFHILEKLPFNKQLAFTGRHALIGYVGHFLMVFTVLRLMR